MPGILPPVPVIGLPPPEPGYRACDDEELICRGTIYAFPIWEIDPDTGMIILYAADPATGQLILNSGHRPTPVAQVAAAGLSRPDARPQVVWDYVGQTIRELEIRTGEHAADRCWADVIAGQPWIVEQGQWDKQTRDGKEVAAIARLAPRFNRRDNEHNPDRIPVWRQLELRHARDRALDRDPWQSPEHRAVAALAGPTLALAGQDAAQLRYPLTMTWDLLRRLVRWVSCWRPLARAVALVALAWIAATSMGGYALIRWDWAPPYAWLVSVAVNTAIGISIVRGRRKRRRRR